MASNQLVIAETFTSSFTDYLRQGQMAVSVTKTVRFVTDQLAQSQKKAADSAGKLAGQIKKAVSASVGFKDVKAVFALSDALAQTTARLDQMNDGLQSTQQLNQMIVQSAMRARTSYAETASFVATLGTLADDAFSSSGEIVAFAEQVNKQIALSGASAQASEAAMSALTNGMAAGTLSAQGLNTLLEKTPAIAQTIGDYMGMTTTQMTQFASEGKLSADVVKNALLSAAAETDAAFSALPLTWSQVWTMGKNVAVAAMAPLLKTLNDLANHMEIVAPIVLGLGAAFAVFLVAANWVKICSAATEALKTAQTMASSAAAVGWAIPLMVIALVVGAIYAIVAAYNSVTGATVSATGLIAGLIAAMAAVVGNIVVGLFNGIIQAAWTICAPILSVVEWVMNVLNGGFDSFGGAVANLLGNIISWFLDLGKVVTKIVDAIFGTNWTGGLESLQSSVLQWGKNENAVTLDRTLPQVERFSYQDAYQSGYQWGENLEEKFSGLFSSEALKTNPSDFQQLTGDVSSIAGNVGSIEKSVNMAQEDLTALVDMAERRYVSNVNLTAQTPVIHVSGQNTGNTPEDRQALANTIRDILIEQTAAGSVRSTARTV